MHLVPEMLIGLSVSYVKDKIWLTPLKMMKELRNRTVFLGFLCLGNERQSLHLAKCEAEETPESKYAQKSG